MVFQFSFVKVGYIQFQVIDSLLCKCPRLQYLHLVVETIGVRDNAQVGCALYGVTTSTPARVLVFDQKFGSGLVYWRCITQIYMCCTQTYNQGEDEPFPIENNRGVNCGEIKT